MSIDTKILFSEALALPPVTRAALIEELLASFDNNLRTSVDRLWAEESEARIDAYERGEISAQPLEAVIETINRQ